MPKNSDVSDGKACPCNPQRLYADCCQPFHQGFSAPTPEALMRSRYSAFVFRLKDYLLKTWHRTSRPAELDLVDSPQLYSLEVTSGFVQSGGKDGVVTFCAVYRTVNGWGKLEERSDFVKEGGQWYYLGGKIKDAPFKPGRNDLCPCGSGRKYKSCCL